MNRNIVFLILLGFTLLGCHYNNQYINEKEDKEAAEKVADIFYETVKQEDYASNEKLLSKEFNKVETKDKWGKFLRKADSLLGKVESKELVNWQTIRLEGSDSQSNYTLQYKVKREKYEAVETITMQKEGDSIKINRYDINSEGLLPFRM